MQVLVASHLSLELNSYLKYILFEKMMTASRWLHHRGTAPQQRPRVFVLRLHRCLADTNI